MIPKKIHYCWFGNGKKSKSVEKCVASWRKLCPDYTLKEWNEENSDAENWPEFVKEAYKNKKYAFVSDYVRLFALYSEGGIYMDTDVELIKRPDDILGNRAFFGFESDDFVATGLMFAAEEGHKCLEDMMNIYKSESFYKPDGSFNLLGCPIVNTEVLENFGLKKDGKEQILNDGIHIYPKDYFNPFDTASDKLELTENTISIHWYSMSWMPPAKQLKVKLMRPVHRILGADIKEKLTNFRRGVK